MAYPFQFVDGYDFGNGNGPLGAYGFQRSGNQYVLLFAGGVGGDSKWHVFKSTDMGQSWTEQDSVNAPGIGAGTKISTIFAPTIDGDLLRFLWPDTTFAAGPCPNFTITNLVFETFDMSTDTWGISATIGNPGVDFANDGLTACQTRICMQLITRGTSDYVLYASGTQGVSGGNLIATCSYWEFDGATFSAQNALPNPNASNANWPTGAVIAAGGTIHFFFTDGPFAVADLFHVSFASGTFSSVETVSTTAIGHQEFITAPIIYNDGTNNRLLVVGEARITGDDYPVSWSSVIGSGTWNQTTITTDFSVIPTFQGFAIVGRFFDLAYDGDKIICSFATTTQPPTVGGPGHVYASTASPTASLTWATPALAFDMPNDAFGDPYPAVQVRNWQATGGYMVVGIGISNNNFIEVTLATFFATTPTPSAFGNVWDGATQHPGNCFG